jgi:hypothetical protein
MLRLLLKAQHRDRPRSALEDTLAELGLVADEVDDFHRGAPALDRAPLAAARGE